jgi:integrase
MHVTFHPRTIAKLWTPSEGQEDYWDSTLKSFGIRVGAGGRRTWIAMPSINGVKRRFKIGTFPAMPLSVARKQARKVLANAELGIDLAKEKYRRRTAVPMKELVRLYVKSLKKKRRASAKQTEKVLDSDVLPRFRTHKAEEVTKREIIEMLDELDERAPSAARKALEAVRQLFNFGIKRDLLAFNPAALVEAPSEKGTRDRLLPMEEICALVCELTKENYPEAAAILLVLLTLCRSAEIRSMRRSSVAWHEGSLKIEETKNRKKHAVPINPLVRRLVERQLELYPDGEFVFQSQVKEGAHLSGSHLLRVLKQVLKRAGVDEAWLHDLRRTAATHLGRLDVDERIIARLLNHRRRSVTDLYNLWQYFLQRREALLRWEMELLGEPRIRAAIDVILSKECDRDPDPEVSFRPPYRRQEPDDALAMGAQREVPEAGKDRQQLHRMARRRDHRMGRGEGRRARDRPRSLGRVHVGPGVLLISLRIVDQPAIRSEMHPSSGRSGCAARTVPIRYLIRFRRDCHSTNPLIWRET